MLLGLASLVGAIVVDATKGQTISATTPRSAPRRHHSCAFGASTASRCRRRCSRTTSSARSRASSSRLASRDSVESAWLTPTPPSPSTPRSCFAVRRLARQETPVASLRRCRAGGGGLGLDCRQPVHRPRRVGQLKVLVDLRRHPEVAVPHELHGGGIAVTVALSLLPWFAPATLAAWLWSGALLPRSAVQHVLKVHDEVNLAQRAAGSSHGYSVGRGFSQQKLLRSIELHVRQPRPRVAEVALMVRHGVHCDPHLIDRQPRHGQ